MAEILSGAPTASVAYFCPKCGSPDLGIVRKMIETAIGTATCNTCKWAGSERELAAAPFKHEFASEQAIAERMVLDLRNIMAKVAAPVFGKFLLKWGFIDQPITATQLARFIQAIATAIIPAVIAERKKIVEEQHGPTGQPDTTPR